MHTEVTTRACPSCGEAAETCTIGRPLTRGYHPGQQARCCDACAHPERVVRTSEHADVERGPAGARAAPSAPLSKADEDETVDRLLELAAVEQDRNGVEQADRPRLGAYRSLAQSRGVSLEHVIRQACRGRLGDVVRKPTIALTVERNPR